MPRTENSLDPLAGPVAAFAYDLRKLREKAGHVPYRVLAKRAGFSASTLSVAASGRVLPSLDVTLAYVQACGADPDPWRQRWQTLIQEPESHDSADVPVREASRDAPPPTSALERATRRLPAVTVSIPAAVTVPAPAVGPVRNIRHRVARTYTALATAAIAVIAFALASGAIGTRVASSGLGIVDAAAGRLQLGDLYQVICQGAALHANADANAYVDLRSQADWPREREFLLTAATVRWEQAEQVSSLDVSRIPDGALIAKVLHDSWTDRTMADMYYAMYAESPGDHASTSSTLSALDQAQVFDDAAQASENEAVSMWNSQAPALGEPQISLRAL